MCILAPDIHVHVHVHAHASAVSCTCTYKCHVMYSMYIEIRRKGATCWYCEHVGHDTCKIQTSCGVHTCLWSYNVLLASYYPEEERDRERRPASDQLSRGVAVALLHWSCPPLSPLAHWVEGVCPVEGDDGDGWLGGEGGV